MEILLQPLSLASNLSVFLRRELLPVSAFGCFSPSSLQPVFIQTRRPTIEQLFWTLQEENINILYMRTKLAPADAPVEDDLQRESSPFTTFKS